MKKKKHEKNVKKGGGERILIFIDSVRVVTLVFLTLEHNTYFIMSYSWDLVLP
jgi:hypothetical protein